MSSVYESIMAGLTEAVEEKHSGKTILQRRTVSIEPVKRYNAAEIKSIRKKTGFSQKMFAGYIGVSPKTVEAWEAGINQPAGAASRILRMMEIDTELTEKYPFVK